VIWSILAFFVTLAVLGPTTALLWVPFLVIFSTHRVSSLLYPRGFPDRTHPDHPGVTVTARDRESDLILSGLGWVRTGGAE
jgi:hypothetical protein